MDVQMRFNLMVQRSRNFFTPENIKKSLMCSIVTLLIILCIATVISVGSSRRYPSQKGIPLCETPECIAISHQLLSYVDASVDPCEDFYQYACGGWVNNHRDGDKDVSSASLVQNAVDLKIKNLLESNWSSDDDNINSIFKQVKAFYNSCLHHNETDKQEAAMLKNLVNLIVKGNVLKSSGPLTDLFTTMIEFGSTLYFRFEIGDTDEKNSDGVILQISRPNKNFGPSAFIMKKLSENVTEAKQKQTIDLASEVLLEICAEQNISVKKLYFQLNQFNKEHQKISAGAHSNSKTMTIKELQKSFGTINWEKLLTELYGFKFSSDDYIKVEDPLYMTELNKLLENHLNSKIKVILGFHFSHLAVQIMNAEKTRDVCLEYTKTTLPFSLSIIFTEVYSKFLFEVNKEANVIFDEIKRSLIETIENCNWMSFQTKSNFLQKARELKGHFGDLKLKSDDWIYTNLSLVKVQPHIFLDNWINFNYLNAYHTRRIFTKYKLDANKTQAEIYHVIGEMGSFVANAFYQPNSNQIFVNLAYLNLPNYARNAPKYITFSNLGFVLAHEMFHAFDAQKIKFDHFGNLNNLLASPEDEIAYENKNKCFTDKYPEYFQLLVKTKPGYNETLKLNGTSTLADNFADTAIEVAYKAYKSYLKTNLQDEESVLPGIYLEHEKVFFINAVQPFCSTIILNHYPHLLFADDHSPLPERMNFIAMNSKDFSRVFQCPSSSRMNPKVKCSLW